MDDELIIQRLAELKAQIADFDERRAGLDDLLADGLTATADRTAFSTTTASSFGSRSASSIKSCILTVSLLSFILDLISLLLILLLTHLIEELNEKEVRWPWPTCGEAVAKDKTKDLTFTERRLSFAFLEGTPRPDSQVFRLVVRWVRLMSALNFCFFSFKRKEKPLHLSNPLSGNIASNSRIRL